MNKRTDSIRSMFTARPPESLSADNASPASGASQRVSAGSVRSMKESFSGFERENDVLRAQIASGASIVEIDPNLIDASPVADRFSEDDKASYEALRQSIHERGQEVPVLLRRHPLDPGRYESAYGHRRVRVARDLGRPVKAVIRTLSDEDLVVAQGIENSAREDLTFIERAVFAMRLEARGFDRRIVQTALSIDKAEASKLVAVAKAVPEDIVKSIGRAPKVGRGRWQSLSETFEGDAQALAKARRAALADGFQDLESDTRFVTLLDAVRAGAGAIKGKAEARSILSERGTRIAQLSRSPKELKLTIDRETEGAFADYLSERLPALYESFRQSQDGQKES